MKTINILMLAFLGFSTLSNAQYTIKSVHGNLAECDTLTRGIYIIWWDKDFNLRSKASIMLDSMLLYRNICLTQYGMKDPPNTGRGFYYNVYIHVPSSSQDFFKPNNWAAGQGTDTNKLPFLSLPDNTDVSTISHETFHIFQYSGTSPGYAYTGNSQWFIEASANWFAAKRNPSAVNAFITAESLTRLPHVPFWLSFSNFPATYPKTWQRYVHQYALVAWLYYLTDVVGVPDSYVTEGMYNNTTQLPQEYMYNKVGGTTYRNHFIDWAARMMNDFDFLQPAQKVRNLQEWNNVAPLWDDKKFVVTYTNPSKVDWYQPADSMVTNGWSFNSYRIVNNQAKSYNFELKGDATGTYGTAAYFQSKLVVRNSATGTRFLNIPMTNNNQRGSFTYTAAPTDTAIYWVIASMPAIFGDFNPNFQLFRYQMSISSATSVKDIENPETLKIYPSVTSNVLTVETAATPVRDNATHYQVFNLHGQEVLNGKKPALETWRLDVSNLPKGTYIVKVGLEQAKFVKQ